jgi:hypothetical protein
VLRGDIDLWMVERTPTAGASRSGSARGQQPAADELYPSVSRRRARCTSRAGRSSRSPGRHFDIYRAERRATASRRARRWARREHRAGGRAGGLQDAWEFNPEISVDGRTLVFTSLRPGGFGLGDLYVSRLEGGAWTPARNLGPLVNTAADEYHPTLSRDRRTLWFVRRGPARGDFYQIATRALDGL